MAQSWHKHHTVWTFCNAVGPKTASQARLSASLSSFRGQESDTAILPEYNFIHCTVRSGHHQLVFSIAYYIPNFRTILSFTVTVHLPATPIPIFKTYFSCKVFQSICTLSDRTNNCRQGAGLTWRLQSKAIDCSTVTTQQYLLPNHCKLKRDWALGVAQQTETAVKHGARNKNWTTDKQWSNTGRIWLHARLKKLLSSSYYFAFQVS